MGKLNNLPITPSLINSKGQGFDWNSTLAAYLGLFSPSHYIYIYIMLLLRS